MADSYIRGEIDALCSSRRDLLDLYSCAQRALNTIIGGAKCAFTGADVVNELLVDLYDNRRTWNREEVHDIKAFVQSQVRSKVSNMLNHDHRLCRENEDADGEPGRDVFDPQGYTPDFESEIDSGKMDADCCKLFEGDEEALPVFRGIREGDTNLEIAADTGYTIREVENARKRIRRKLDEYFGRETAVAGDRHGAEEKDK